jgi:hypothetical protein
MTTYEQRRTITVPDPVRTNDTFDELDGIAFHETEQAEKPITEEARLWWFNGLPTDTDRSAIGWHIKAGINPVLDETMEGLSIEQYLVQHKRPDRDGKTTPKPYWHLRTCNPVIVAQRLQSQLEMNRSTDDRQGIAYAWKTVLDDTGKPAINKNGKPKRQTMLKLRVFVHELYQHGYYDWLPFTLSGFGTDYLLETLGEQYRVLETYSGLRRAQGKNPVAPFYLFSLTLGPGKAKLVGEQSDQGTIYPIVAQVPQTIDTTYLKAHVIPTPLIERIRDGFLSETIVWSIEESVRIASGQDQGEPATLIEGPASMQTSSLQDENDPLIQQPQRTWILGDYCGNNEQKIHDICGYFGVTSSDQLRMSHFRTLVKQVQATPSSR